MRRFTTTADDLTSLFASGSDFRSGDPIILFYAGRGVNLYSIRMCCVRYVDNVP